MDTYFDKDLFLTAITIILILFQGAEKSIFIEAGLIFTTLELARSKKIKEKKFDYYIWSIAFICFILQFIIKAFILV